MLIDSNVKFFNLLYGLVLVDSVVNIDYGLIVLKETKEHFELRIWDWIITDVKVPNVFIHVACKVITDCIETFEGDLTVFENNCMDSLVLVKHFKDCMTGRDCVEIVITQVNADQIVQAACHPWQHRQFLATSIFEVPQFLFNCSFLLVFENIFFEQVFQSYLSVRFSLFDVITESAEFES